MASDDPNYNAFHKSNIGCFGLFECVNDRAVASALFDAASHWLREKGRDEIMGPIDYSTNYVCGLLVDGFQFPPTLLTGHNPPYYESLVQDCGFAKVIDFYAWWFAEPAPPVPPSACGGSRLLCENCHSAVISSGDSQETSRSRRNGSGKRTMTPGGG